MSVETVLGVLRTIFLVPRIGEFHARQIGTLISSLLILGIAYLVLRWLGVVARRQLIIVDLVWVAFTLLFELMLGHVVMDLSWNRLMSDYNIVRGWLLPFGWLIFTFAPLIAARIQGLTLNEGEN